MPRIQRLGIAAVMAAVMLVGGAPAFATEPLTTSGHVTDPDGFLSDEQRAAITSRAESFNTAYDTTIDVVVVPNFSGQKPSDWCKATLKQSRTGEKGILYVVSYEDGTDAFCTDAKMAREMSDYSTRMMMDSALSAAHRKYKTTPLPPEEAAAGAEAFIRDLRSSYDISADLAASHRKRQEQEKKAREEREKEEKKRKRGANILISAVVVIAIVSNVWVWVRKLNGDDEPTTETTYRSPEPEEYTPIVDTVRRDALRAATEARRRLSEAEEQVRAAEEDWNYARAQFGSAATEQFGRRLEAAKDAIARGFDTYEQIERTPDAHAKRRLASTITADLDKNLPPLQDARQEFAAQSEKRLSLPAQVADARERLVEELADLERAKEELTSIAGLYPDSMLASLQDNPERAATLLE
ncbi:MAG: TPM domain-containing protein, partial [Thermobifida sp.]|nr:TPM domain-containing protein [Thermobifida sp.]